MPSRHRQNFNQTILLKKKITIGVPIHKIGSIVRSVASSTSYSSFRIDVVVDVDEDNINDVVVDVDVDNINDVVVDIDVDNINDVVVDLDVDDVADVVVDVVFVVGNIGVGVAVISMVVDLHQWR